MEPQLRYLNFMYPESSIAGRKGLLKAFHVTPNQAHKSAVNATCFSPDGSQILTASSDKTIRIWKVDTSALARVITAHRNAIWAMRVVNNTKGQFIVSGSGDCTIKVFDLVSGSLLRTLKEHDGPIWTIDVSADSKYIVSGSEDKTVCLWDFQTGTLLKRIQVHSKAIQSVVFSSDGKSIISASSDNSICISDTSKGSLIRRIIVPSGINSIAVSSDIKFILAGLKAPKYFAVFDFHTGKEIPTSIEEKQEITSICVLPSEDSYLAGTENGLLTLRKLSTWTLLNSFHFITARINSIGISPNALDCIVGLSDGTASLWDLNKFSRKTILGRSEYCLETFCITPDGMDIYSSSEIGKIQCWSIQTGDVFKNWQAHEHLIPDISLSSSGKYLASSTEVLEHFRSTDVDEISVWDVSAKGDPRKISSLSDTGSILATEFSPDERLLVGGGDSLFVWEKETLNLIKKYDPEGGKVTCLALSSDGTFAAVGTLMGGINIYNLKEGKLIETISDEETPWALKITKDMKMIVGGGDKRTVFVWDFHTFKLIRAYEGHTENITAVDVSDDGRYIASGSDDREVRVWDIQSSSSYGPFTHAREISEVYFLPGSNIVIASDVNGDICLWDFLGTEKNLLKSRKVERPNVRVLFIGDKGVGKTSLINTICPTEATAEENPLDTSSTLGCEVRIVAGNDNIFYWDFGGQRMFRVVHQFFSRGNACIAVVVFDGSRMDSIRPAIDTFRYWIEILIKNFSKKLKLIIVQNKCDQVGTFAIPVEFQNQLNAIVEKYRLGKPQEIITSAKTKVGLETLVTAIRIFAGDGSLFNQEIYSVMDFDAIDTQIKQYEKQGDLFVEFEKFFKDCQKTAYNNLAKTKDIASSKLENVLSEKQITFYLDHLEASGKLLVLAEYGSEKNFICLKPILVSKILSAVSISAFKNNDVVSLTDFNTIFNQLNEDSFFRIDYSDHFRRNAEKWFLQVMNIGTELNALIEEKKGDRWRILNYQNQIIPPEYDALINESQVIQYNYFVIDQLPQTILSLLVNLLVNQKGFKLIQNWSTEQKNTIWLSAKLTHQIKKLQVGLQLMTDKSPKKGEPKKERTEEEKAQDFSETIFDIIIESISPKGPYSPSHFIGYRIYVPPAFKYLGVPHKSYYLSIIKEIDIYFMIRLFDQVSSFKWVFPFLIICKNKKCRNFILDYTINRSQAAFCNKCAARFDFNDTIWEKLPQISLNMLIGTNSHSQVTGEKQLKRKLELNKIEAKLQQSKVIQPGDSPEQVMINMLSSIIPDFMNISEIRYMIQRSQDQSKNMFEIVQMQQERKKNLERISEEIKNTTKMNAEDIIPHQLRWRMIYHEEISKEINSIKDRIATVNTILTEYEEDNEFEKVEEMQQSLNLLRSESRQLFLSMDPNLSKIVDNIEMLSSKQKVTAETLNAKLNPDDWNRLRNAWEDYRQDSRRLKDFITYASKELSTTSFKLLVSLMTGVIFTDVEITSDVAKNKGSTGTIARPVLSDSISKTQIITPPFSAYDGPDSFLFASYAHDDRERIYPLLDILHHAGIRIWYDEGIPTSSEWLKIIAEKIANCSSFIVFLTNLSITRGHIYNEIVMAIEGYLKHEIQFIPVYLDKITLPPKLNLILGPIQGLMKFKFSEEKFIEKLVGAPVKQVREKK